MTSALVAADSAPNNGGGSDEAVKNQWKPCAEWLFRCLTDVPDILQTAQTVLGDPQSTVMDLLGLLKDGILLCHILPALSCNDITLDSLDGFKLMTLNSPFVFKKNVIVFLNQCETYFGLNRSELFRAEDLLEQENIIGIIDALSTLSRCPRARQSGIVGFEVARCSPQAESDYYSFVADSLPEPVPVHSRHRQQQQQQQEGQLQNQARHIGARSCGVSRGGCSQQAEEMIYDCIINARKQQEIPHNNNTTQQRNKNTMQQTQQQPKSQLQQQQVAGLTAQDMCIQEMVDTERNYVETLRLLVEDVMRPMRAKQSSWSAEEVEVIFRFLPELFSLHQKLFQELQTVVLVSKLERNNSLSQMFASFKEKMLIYGQFGGHLARAQKLIESACKSDKRKNEELQRHLSNCRAMFKLGEYLTIPVQRVLKYHLLLSTLIGIEEKQAQKQPSTQLDLSQLREAHEAMCEVADYVNEVKRDSEMITLIDQIQDSIDDLQLPASMRLINYGRLQMDEELKVANDPVNPTSGSKLYHCFLWNRICMLVESRSLGRDGYVFKSVFAIRADLVIKAIDCSQTDGKGGFLSALPLKNKLQQPSSGNSNWTWTFLATDCRLDSAQQLSAKDSVNIVFLAKTSESRQRWLEAFQRAKDTLAPLNFNMFGHYFEAATFESPTYCSVCNKLILGCFYQGYQCRKTNKKVHQKCIPRIGGGVSAGSTKESPGHPLAKHDWFFGQMSREQARNALLHVSQSVGTFLVRSSKTISSNCDCVISLRCGDTVKHMRIQQAPNVHYLSEVRTFPSVEALVTHYSSHSLSECFTDLDTTLARPLQPTAADSPSLY